MWFFNIHSVVKQQRTEEGKFSICGKKSHSAEKKLKGGPFGIFHHPFCRKTAKKLKGDPLRKKNSGKKSLAVPKKIGRGYGMLRGKTGKTVLVQFARPISAIWCNNIL